MKTRSSRSISSRSAWFNASRYEISAIAVSPSIRVNVLAHVFDRRLGAFVGETHGIIDHRFDVAFNLLKTRLGDIAFGKKFLAQIFDGIAFQPDAFFALGAILDRIRHRVAAE